jgi:hypothetical protein
MTCHDVRKFADSFLGQELLTETNHGILRHLNICPMCRAEIDGRKRIRTALQMAFDRAPELQPPSNFADQLRERLHDAHPEDLRSWAAARRWFGLAACVLLTAGLTVTVLLNRSMFQRHSPVSADKLAEDAIGDHWNCALKFRAVRTPVPLDEAAERFDVAFRVLLDMPPDDISTPTGPAHVVERHSCAYGTRRFGHVVMQYRGRVVSLLMTTTDQETARAVAAAMSPHLIGRPTKGLSVVAVNGSSHTIVLVSDLGSGELTQLSTAVAIPLARRLDVGATQPDGTIAALPLCARSTSKLRSRLGSHEGDLIDK